jgi:hypothetical protein
MTNLLAFAFMLRNAGIDDQGLVEHLSEATAGSLTGELGCKPATVLVCAADTRRRPLGPVRGQGRV